MAEERKQDLLGRLADLSEEAIQKLADAPGADKVLHAFKGLADKVDELQRRTKGYEELESRLTALEEKVSGLGGGSSDSAEASSSSDADESQ